MEIYNLYPGSMGSNCYIVISGSSAAVIDPSASADGILDFLNKKDASLECIVLTHGHFDHMFSADTLRNLTGAPLYIHENDAENLRDGEKNAFKIFFGREREWMPPEGKLVDGEIVKIGDESLRIINTPGHTKGSICLRMGDILLSGDTLFRHSYGRIDLPTGAAMDMLASIRKLLRLEGNATVYPGHEAFSTLDEEREQNPLARW